MDENPYEPSQAEKPSVRHSRQPALTSRGLFGVVVRSVGLLLLVYAAWSLPGVFLPAPGFAPSDYLIGMVPVVLIGGILLFAADGIVAMAYRFSDDRDES